MSALCDRAGCEHGRPEAVAFIRWRWRAMEWMGWQDYPVCAPCRDILWPMFDTPDIERTLVDLVSP